MNEKNYDVLVVGGGVAGQETSLNLANMGYKVLVAEKDLSIGGKMIHLSKVFPTLDCAACITTPKMGETARHPNITVLTNTQVSNIRNNGSGYKADLTIKPRYVDANACTGCSDCEANCPVFEDDQYMYGSIARKTAYIPFTTASPKVAAIDRKDHSSPCISRCPGGVKAHGFVSLAKDGLYEEAFKLHLEDNPLPGSLGRACYAPCEGECTRDELEGSVEIRRVKRYFTDYVYDKYTEAPKHQKADATGKKVAVIGSGPAGLTAAYHLALKGHEVKIFEADKELGGMLRSTLPSFRLPKKVVDRDIENILNQGVQTEVNAKITDLNSLKDQGYDAVFVSVGTHSSSRLGIDNAHLKGVEDCLDFLKNINAGNHPDYTGKKVMVFGGGNVAMDTARVALRLGATEVTVAYRRTKEEMPADQVEIEEAVAEGVKFLYLTNPVSYSGENDQLKAVECIKMELGEPDDSGRRRPVPVKGSEYYVDADIAIEAIGLNPETSDFSNDVSTVKWGAIEADDTTLQTNVPHIFAGGDVVKGASSIIEACGQGKQAAFYIDRFVKGEELTAANFEDRLEALPKADVLKKVNVNGGEKATKPAERPAAERIKDFEEIEDTYTEEMLRENAQRCLDCNTCRECHQCVEACPANAIDFTQTPVNETVSATSVVLATGFEMMKPQMLPRFGGGQLKNVVTSIEMEKHLVPTRPYNSVLRLKDGRIPDNIAYVLCAGSRDETAGNPICSQVCCMYSIKQAQLLMGALPLADITIYYIDIRAFGKGFEEFYQRGEGMGVEFVRGKIASIKEIDNDGNLELKYEDIESGKIKKMEHDMVVLSIGVEPNMDNATLFGDSPIELDPYNFVKQSNELISPALTSKEGVFVSGTAAGPKDIPDTILAAGNAASETASYLRKQAACADVEG